LRGNGEVNRRLLSQINKLVANHANGEDELCDVYDLLCRHFGLTNKTERTAVARLTGSSSKDNSARKIIAIDFDGVIHSWVEGSYIGDSTKFNNSPVPGAIEWLSSAVNDGRFLVTIYSGRSKILGFEAAMHDWLLENGMKIEDIHKISISVTKPSAFVYIDDRAWKFNGKFPKLDDLIEFKTWYEK
jgi:hypothetical protein